MPQIWDEAGAFTTYDIDPTAPLPPPYTEYTVFTLQEAYCAFWALIFIQSMFLLLVKMKCSNKFHSINWISKTQHIVEILNMPDVFADWDEDEGTVTQHRERRREAVKETVAMAVVHLGCNMLMLVPIWVTGERQYNFSLYILLPHHEVLA